MEIGKGREGRGGFHFGETIQPQREQVLNPLLELLQAEGKEQIPGAERIQNQMNQRMGFDADAMEHPRQAPNQRRRGLIRFSEHAAGCGERRSRLPGPLFQEL